MFELLFKYPPAAFGKGHFVLLSPWPVWLLVAAVVGGAGLLFWHVWRHHGRLSGRRPLAVWALETALLALLLFLLWRPALSVTALRPRQNLIAVVVDDSRSMSIGERGGTRLEQARATLNGGLLAGLNGRFQTRLYRFGRDAERIRNPAELGGAAPASRIGDSLKRVLADSSSLPVGGIVLLSDGADSAGGVGREVLFELRHRRIPVQTVGFGRDRFERDVELVDAVLAPRALPESKLSVAVSFRQQGLSGAKTHVVLRSGGKVLSSREVTLASGGAVQTENLVFNAGAAGPKTIEIAIEPVAGEENRANNAVTRVLQVETRKPRILYIEGEPRWEYKFIRRAAEDDRSLDLVSMLRTTQNKIYRQGIANPKELEDGFPSKAEDLFAYQALIVGSVEASYFTAAQQQLIRDFVDRRGGGLLFLGGRATLSEGGYPHSPLADLLPVELPEAKGVWHRDQTPQQLTAQGRESVICRLEEDPARNLERWKKMPLLANYNEVGAPKAGAVVLMEAVTPARRVSPLLVTENFGRGRAVLFATAGSWRWKMWQDHADQTHGMFWRQLMRFLVTETPGPVTAATPHALISDDASVPLRAEVRDASYKLVTGARVEARVIAPDGGSGTLTLAPEPLEEGVYTGQWSAQQPGGYVVEVAAYRGNDQLGGDVFAFRREDGVEENFRVARNRELLETLARQTGGRYWEPAQAVRIAEEVVYSEAGITSRENKDLWNMPAIFLLALALRASEWLLRRYWGAV
jgi:uncharacterized membrane protein